MWARQMLPQVKIDDRPDKAIIQSKAAFCLFEPAKNARMPRMDAMPIETIGRPLRSM